MESLIKLSIRHFPFLLSARDNGHHYVKKQEEESGNITYIYDEKHIKQRNKKKADKIKKLVKSIKELRKQTKIDIKNEDPKISYPALAVALMDHTYERVGNRYSAEDMKHYGVTTWLKKHIKFQGSKAILSYTGKSGVKQHKEVKDSVLISILKRITKDKKPNESIFETEDYKLNDNLVNQYLRKFDITAKDIRGLHANREVVEGLKRVRKGKLPTDQKEKEKQLKEEFKQVLEEAAEEVGHEPNTLKNQYLIPGIEELYITKGKVIGKISSLKISKRDR